MSLRTWQNGSWRDVRFDTRTGNAWQEAPTLTRTNNAWVQLNQNLTLGNSGHFIANTANGAFRIWLGWQRLSTNTNTSPHTSRVRLNLYWEAIGGWSIFGAGGAGTLTANRTFHIRINGANVSSANTHLNLNCNRFGAHRQVISIERTFNHASDGTLRINIGARLDGANLSLTPGLINLPLIISDRNVNVVTR